MTRWKREETAVVLLLHEHNLWGRWHDFLLDAARELCGVVGMRAYRNSSGDGSWDREWYVLTERLVAANGFMMIEQRAVALASAALLGEAKLIERGCPRVVRP